MMKSKKIIEIRKKMKTHRKYKKWVSNVVSASFQSWVIKKKSSIEISIKTGPQIANYFTLRKYIKYNILTPGLHNFKTWELESVQVFF